MVMFTQDLPEPEESGLAAQLFGIAAAGVGLAVFALVLALVEQLVLQVLEANVQRGSEVYERDHVSVGPKKAKLPSLGAATCHGTPVLGPPAAGGSRCVLRAGMFHAVEAVDGGVQEVRALGVHLEQHGMGLLGSHSSYFTDYFIFCCL